jgi:hypothetical protein
MAGSLPAWPRSRPDRVQTSSATASAVRNWRISHSPSRSGAAHRQGVGPGQDGGAVAADRRGALQPHGQARGVVEAVQRSGRQVRQGDADRGGNAGGRPHAQGLGSDAGMDVEAPPGRGGDRDQRPLVGLPPGSRKGGRSSTCSTGGPGTSRGGAGDQSRSPPARTGSTTGASWARGCSSRSIRVTRQVAPSIAAPSRSPGSRRRAARGARWTVASRGSAAASRRSATARASAAASTSGASRSALPSPKLARPRGGRSPRRSGSRGRRR